MIDFFKRHWLLITLCLLAVFLAVFVRSTNLLKAPPSLYWEEVALGYDAYSIAKTGKDHHGNPWPLVAFESFGDWKPSLYFYTLVPFVSLWGLSPWVVRLPAVISGVATVIAVGVLSYQVAKQLLLSKPSWFGWIGLLLAAISPWLILFSRAGWEVGLATALLSWGVVAGLAAVQTKRYSIGLAVLASILLSLTVYAYHGTRVIAPLVGLLLVGYWWTDWHNRALPVRQYLVRLLAPGLMAIVLLVPIMLSLRSPQVTQRFAETSIFSNLDIIIESNNAKAQLANSPLSALAYHRYVLFGREIMANYLTHFNLDYLVISGDVNARHSTGYSGIWYYQDVLFVAIGVGVLLYRKKMIGGVLLGWWLLGIIPAALTTAVPHALRTLPSAPAILVCMTIGIGYSVLKVSEYVALIWNQNRKLSSLVMALLSIGLVSVYGVTFAVWWRYYQSVYPIVNSSEWQYGYQEMIAAQTQLAQKYPELPQFITREQGRPAMYYWFFTQTEPERVQQAETSSKHDQGEFTTFEKITFPNSTSEITSDQAVVASSPEGRAALEARGYIASDVVSIADPANHTVWQVYQVSKD